MTREEATKIVKDIFVDGPNHCQVRLVDTFEKLGMLKLDEPISAWEKFAGVMVNDFGYSSAEHCKSTTLHDVKESLERAGLNIDFK